MHKKNFNSPGLSYVPYATIENGSFNVNQTKRRNIAAKISGVDVPEAKSKFPAMSVDGNCAPYRNVLREGGDIYNCWGLLFLFMITGVSYLIGV